MDEHPVNSRTVRQEKVSSGNYPHLQTHQRVVLYTTVNVNAKEFFALAYPLTSSSHPS